MGIINAMDVANIDFKLNNVYGFNKKTNSLVNIIAPSKHKPALKSRTYALKVKYILYYFRTQNI